MGEKPVYHAFCAESMKKVVIKKQSDKFGKESQLLHLYEGLVHGWINHPHAIKLDDQGLTLKGERFHVLPHFESDLEKIVTCLQTKINILSDIAEVISHMHDKELIHADIKKRNILVRDGRGYLIDFELVHRKKHHPLLPPGAAAGTPGEIAPEYLFTGKIEYASDTFQFCKTFFETIYGKNAFPFDKYKGILQYHTPLFDWTDFKNLGEIGALIFLGLHEDHTQRPPMKDISDEIRKISTK
jgi:serine/threonine protein kinase